MKIINLKLIILALFLLILPFSSILASDVKVNLPIDLNIVQTTISLVYLNSPSTVKVGDSFQVDINITPVTSISGAQASLKFNGIKLNSIEEGALFKQNNNQTFFYTNNITSDSIGSIVCATLGSGSFINSQGTFAKLNCTALVSGKFDIILQDVLLANSDAQRVDSLVINKSITILP